MNFKRKLKKAFTLVELVVVIAVIAILSAVAAITYMNITDRAREKNDFSVLSTLNNGLAAGESYYGERPATMFDALDSLNKVGGISDPGKFLKAQSKSYEFAYDLEHNRFVLLEGDKIADYDHALTYVSPISDSVKHKFWKIVDKPETSPSGYSLYFADGATFNNDNFAVSAGVDFGTNNFTHTVTYENPTGPAKEVVIRTNSKNTSLTIKAPLDTAKHYGEVGTVTIEKISDSSYFEYGKAKLVDVANGRVVVTNKDNASIGTIYLTATDDNYDSIILASMNGAEIPELIFRDSVTNPTTTEQKKLIATIQQVNDKGESDTSKEEKIYLYAQETAYEQTKGYADVSDMGTLVLEAPVTEEGHLPTDTVIPEDKKEGAESFIETAKQEGKDTSNEVKKEEKADAIIGVSVFAGGVGTKENPWEIVDYDTMQAIGRYANYTLMPNGKELSGILTEDSKFHYWKVKDGISVIDCNQDGRNWNPVNIYGDFDGNGVTFKNLDNYLFKNIGGLWCDDLITIQNFSIIADIGFNASYSSTAAICKNANAALKLKDINVSGRIMSSMFVGSFICFGPGNFNDPSIGKWAQDNPDKTKLHINWTFENCISTASLVNSAGSPIGGFIGNVLIHNQNTNSSITIKDSAFVGTMSGSSAKRYFQGHSNSGLDSAVIKTTYTEAFFNEYDVELLYKNGQLAPVIGESTVTSFNLCEYLPSERISTLNVDDSLISAPGDIGNTFTITRATNATKAYVSIYCMYKDSSVSSVMTEEIELDSSKTFNTETIKNFKFTISKTGEKGLKGNTFNAVDSSGQFYCAPWLKVVQVDGNSNVVAISTYSFTNYTK